MGWETDVLFSGRKNTLVLVSDSITTFKERLSSIRSTLRLLARFSLSEEIPNPQKFQLSSSLLSYSGQQYIVQRRQILILSHLRFLVGVFEENPDTYSGG